MPKLINKTECIDNIWQLAATEALPALLTSAQDGNSPYSHVLLSWSDWLTLGEKSHHLSVASLGIIVPNTTEPEEILAQSRPFDLIAIEFPVFTDGRGYSLARMLREQGFTGELRAIGDVLPDQLFYLSRCGFDTFELKDGKDATNALTLFKTFSVSYQAAADIDAPIYQR